jgi:hypothetical protein
VVGDEVGSGGGDEGGELFDEGEGFEDDSSGSVAFLPNATWRRSKVGSPLDPNAASLGRTGMRPNP